jgi:arylsulfatase A-like enzyme
MDRRDFLKLLPLVPLSLAVGGEARTRPGVAAGAGAAGPNVLVLLFDALAARNMSLYGYPRRTTPNMERFARRATVYHAHHAAGNFTTPGMASILTGLYPWSHRAMHLDGRITPAHRAHNLFRLFQGGHSRIAFPHNTLGHILLQGLRDDIDVYLPPGQFGLDGGTLPAGAFPRDAEISYRSFEKFLFRDWTYPGSLFLALTDRLRLMGYERIDGEALGELYPRGLPTLVQHKWFFLLPDVVDGVMDTVGRARRPFLAYLHLFPPHEPYCPPQDYIGRYDDGWAPPAKPSHFFSAGNSQEELNEGRTQYDEYLAFADDEFGRLHDFLEGSGILDTSYVILTSDHGQLFERGVHGHVNELLYEPLLHVPLLISCPGQRQRVDVHTPTSCVDLLPTLLAAFGQPVPDWCQGQVLPGPGGSTDTGERSIFALEAKGSAVYRPLSPGTVALIRGRHKLIHYFGYPGYEDEYELYDLENDPEELEDRYGVDRDIASELEHELEQKLQEVNRPYEG